MVLKCFADYVNTTAVLKCCTSRKCREREKLQPRTTGQTVVETVSKPLLHNDWSLHREILEWSIIDNSAAKARKKLKYHGMLRNPVPCLESFLLPGVYDAFCSSSVPLDAMRDMPLWNHPGVTSSQGWPEMCFSVLRTLDLLQNLCLAAKLWELVIFHSKKAWFFCWVGKCNAGGRSCAYHQFQCLTITASMVGVRSGISPTWRRFQDSFHTAVIHSDTVCKFLIFVLQIPFNWECQHLYSALPLSLKGSWTELQFLSPFWDILSQANGRNEGAGDTDQCTVWREGCGKIDWTCILSLHGVSCLLR